MFGYIYITTNTVNGKKYIGKHKSRIFNENYKGSGKILIKAFNKYGFDKFITEMICECNSLEELNEMEKYWIDKYNACNDSNFYNIARGGDGGDIISCLSKDDYNNLCNKQRILSAGRKKSPEERMKISKALTGMKRPKEYGIMMSKLKLGTKMSEETKIRMRNSHNPNNIPPTTEGKHWMTNGERNIYVRDEDIEKMISEGWRKGRSMRGNSIKGAKTVNNGIISKKITIDKLQEYLDNGWKLGRLSKKIDVN